MVRLSSTCNHYNHTFKTMIECHSTVDSSQIRLCVAFTSASARPPTSLVGKKYPSFAHLLITKHTNQPGLSGSSHSFLQFWSKHPQPIRSFWNGCPRKTNAWYRPAKKRKGFRRFPFQRGEFEIPARGQLELSQDYENLFVPVSGHVHLLHFHLCAQMWILWRVW